VGSEHRRKLPAQTCRCLSLGEESTQSLVSCAALVVSTSETAQRTGRKQEVSGGGAGGGGDDEAEQSRWGKIK
jgi:hypothetical protein